MGLGRRRRHDEASADEIVENLGDAIAIGHNIDDRRGQRERHPRVRGGIRVLDHHRAAGKLHLAGANRPVRAASGQYDRDQVLGKDLGSRGKEQVD